MGRNDATRLEERKRDGAETPTDLGGDAVALTGAGPWSLDAWLFGDRHNIAARDINPAARSVFGR
jgi:hypothetical protein